MAQSKFLRPIQIQESQKNKVMDVPLPLDAMKWNR